MSVEIAPRFASTLRAATAFTLSAGEAIGGRWLRRRRRVLLPEGKLTFQVCDTFGLFGDLALALGELLTQPFNLLLEALLSVRSRLPLRSRHASDGTPIGSICTVPLAQDNGLMF